MRREYQRGSKRGDIPHNAALFLYAYTCRMPGKTGYRGSHAQKYHNWRTGWLFEITKHLPDWQKQHVKVRG